MIHRTMYVVLTEISGAGGVWLTEVPAAPEWRPASPQFFPHPASASSDMLTSLSMTTEF